MANFISFKNIGLNTLQASSAFSKIRNATKVYNSHLVHTPSSLTSKYHKLNSLFSTENDFLTTSSFGIKKQHNLASVSALGNTYGATILDTASFDKFLNTNLALNSVSTNEQLLSPTAASALSLEKSSNVSISSSDTARVSSLLNSPLASSSARVKLSEYPTLLENVNDNSDKAGLAYSATKLTSPNLAQGEVLNVSTTFDKTNLIGSSSGTSSYVSLERQNDSTSSKVYNLSGPNSKVLLGDQSIRSYPEIVPSKSNYNLSSDVNPVLANANFATKLNRSENPFSSASSARLSYPDQQQFNKLAGARSLISESHPAVLSSDPRLSNSLNYDSTSSVTRSISYTTKGTLEDTVSVKKSAVGEVFVGSREKTPTAINTAY